MKNNYKLQARKRVAKRYAITHREIFGLSALAAGVLVVLLVA